MHEDRHFRGTYDTLWLREFKIYFSLVCLFTVVQVTRAIMRLYDSEKTSVSRCSGIEWFAIETTAITLVTICRVFARTAKYRKSFKLTRILTFFFFNTLQILRQRNFFPRCYWTVCPASHTWCTWQRCLSAHAPPRSPPVTWHYNYRTICHLPKSRNLVCSLHF